MTCPLPNCNGIEHNSRCHACPHTGDPAIRTLPWGRGHPCWHCVTTADGGHDPNDSREQGHGRVSSAEAVPPHLVASIPDVSGEERAGESWQGDFSAVAHAVLRALLNLPPKELATLLASLKLNADGTTRTLLQIKAVTDALFHENVTLQAVDIRIRRAYEALTERDLDSEAPAFMQVKRSFRRFLCF